MTRSKRKTKAEVDDCGGHYWNERVIRRTDHHGYHYFAIHEVFYENHRPTKWTEEPVSPMGDSFDELREAVDQIRSALDAPTLVEVEDSDGQFSLIDEENCGS